MNKQRLELFGWIMELASFVQGLHSEQSKQLEDSVRTGIRDQLFLLSDARAA